MQPGTVQGGGKTTVGNNNLFMAYVHVAHDCIVGDQNVLANCAQLAGHVTIQNMTVLGGVCAVHQFVVVGDMAMVAGGSMLKQDLPPFCMADGFRAGLRGLNSIALQRRNISAQARVAIKNVYKIIFSDNHPTIQDAIKHVDPSDASYAEVQKFINFIRDSKRGVIRPLSAMRSGEYADET